MIMKKRRSPRLIDNKGEELKEDSVLISCVGRAVMALTNHVEVSLSHPPLAPVQQLVKDPSRDVWLDLLTIGHAVLSQAMITHDSPLAQSQR
mmetsp:Transcript_18457/g.43117  ORF Transcript_18457/g.43117 Transcript_18457/m.43117 type:complete len:92 (-) Transcript_18457:1199-1474(-)